jgi:hypothetical protein
MRTNPYKALLGITASVVLTLTASADWNSLSWDGKRGVDSEKCELVGEDGRTADGWIHWVAGGASAVTEAVLELGGTGTGTYEPYKSGGALQFYTPFFALDGLTATLYYQGTFSENPVLTISDWCDGPQPKEELKVSKTVKTSFTREHKWDIAKKVETQKGCTVDGTPKVWLFIDGKGDEKATWTVNVSYDGYHDSEFKLCGEITIENTGELDATITRVFDTLGLEIIEVDCGLPVTLKKGDILTCTYSVDGYVDATENKVTVYTTRAEYSAIAPIVWGDPTKEINKTVTIKDASDLFGDVTLGTVTAPHDKEFKYCKTFAWQDYGVDACGSFTYNNTASIVETGQHDSATLKVNVQCYLYETAFAKGPGAECFIPTFSNWGWTNPIGAAPVEVEMELWAAAGQCDTSNGTLVGKVIVTWDGADEFWVEYELDEPNHLKEYHVYAGVDKFPFDRRGRPTVAPGQYSVDTQLINWVIAHGVVGIPDPEFGP